MDLGHWYIRRGRISRRTWWLDYTVPFAVMGAVAGLIDSFLGFPEVASAGWSIYTYTGGPVSVVVILATFAPSVSSTVARLHDRHHTAWWLLWILVPVAGPVVLLIQAGFLAGSVWPNDYGPPPTSTGTTVAYL